RPLTSPHSDPTRRSSDLAQNPNHTYTTPGTYTVTLGVSTAVGDNTASKGSYIVVSVPPTVPAADFIADQTNGFVPLAVNFTDTSGRGGLPMTSSPTCIAY